MTSLTILMEEPLLLQFMMIPKCSCKGDPWLVNIASEWAIGKYTSVLASRKSTQWKHSSKYHPRFWTTQLRLFQLYHLHWLAGYNMSLQCPATIYLFSTIILKFVFSLNHEYLFVMYHAVTDDALCWKNLYNNVIQFITSLILGAL